MFTVKANGLYFDHKVEKPVFMADVMPLSQCDGYDEDGQPINVQPWYAPAVWVSVDGGHTFHVLHYTSTLKIAQRQAIKFNNKVAWKKEHTFV